MAERSYEVNVWKLGARRRAGCLPMVAAALFAIIAGCAYKGGKVVEGTDFSAGISLPGTEGAAEVSFVNYLSGFRFGIAENAGMECEYRGTNTFSFAWGLYEGKAEKYFKAKVEPCETTPQNENDKQKEER